MRIALVLGAFLWAATAQAAVISVTTPDPGSAVADDGQCSLPEAITAANTNTASGGMVGECPAGDLDPTVDTIVLSGDVTLTVVLDTTGGNNGLPSVTSPITIEGGGRTVARDSAPLFFRIFHVAASGDLTLDDVTVSNGVVPEDGGGLLNYGTLTLTYSTLSGNDASSFGGGLHNLGTATLTNSTVSGNAALIGGSGLSNLGAATLMNSTVLENFETQFGGGIVNGGSLTLMNSTVSGNSAHFGGGGLLNLGAATLMSSTVSENSLNPRTASYWGGGGLLNLDALSTVALINSTVSGNSSNQGGALANSGGTATLTNSTVLGNSGGGLRNTLGTATITGSIVASSPSFGNCDGVITDNGNNFADDTTCGAGFATITAGVDFDTMLADNGGPTLTHALLAGSVAIDAAGSCGPAADQRGAPRPGAACDSGSFEVQPPVCANGFVDHGEQCDDGNTDPDDCCSATCQIETANACCTAAGTCDVGSSGCGAVCMGLLTCSDAGSICECVEVP